MSHFPCPTCGAEHSKVIHNQYMSGSIHRRRRCVECRNTFKTMESVVVGPDQLEAIRTELIDKTNETVRALKKLRTIALHVIKS